MKNSKKFDLITHKNEDHETKSYFKTMKLKESRTMFSIRSMTTKTIKSHQMSNNSYAKKIWQCSCGSIDSISHVKRCEDLQELRLNLDIENNDVDLVKFFQEVIKLRNKTQKE